MNRFWISLGMTAYTLSILFFALKPIVKKLLSLKIVIFIFTLSIPESEKYRSQEVALNKIEKGHLRDYGTAFYSVLALMVRGRRFLKIMLFFEVFDLSLT